MKKSEQIILYIYSKKGEVKALTSEQGKNIGKGWKHEATIDAKKWIEYYYYLSPIEKYEAACNELVEEFCIKQDMCFEGWVGNNIGKIAVCNDFYFNISDIALDIKKNAPVGLIIDWYYDNVEQEKTINYNSYIMGLRHKDLNANL